jgi:predicted Zn finger-like uncharacterized protein
MKVVCESCQAKYQVPDERVAGKKLKIRCKRCGATVLIRGDLVTLGAGSDNGARDSVAPSASLSPIDSAALSPASTPSLVSGALSGTNSHARFAGDAHAGASAAASANGANVHGPAANAREIAGFEWHASLDGDTRGPFSIEELRAWLNGTPSGWDAHVWHEGFHDWIEARACAELEPPPPATVERLQDADDQPTQTFQAQSVQGAQFMAELGSSTAQGLQSPVRRPQSQISPATRPRTASGFAETARAAAVATGFGESIASSSVGAAAASGMGRMNSTQQSSGQLAGDRHDDSVLFSTSSLHSMTGTTAPSYTPGPNPGFASGEGSGLIDIRALASLARASTAQLSPNPASASKVGTAAAVASDTGISFGADEMRGRGRGRGEEGPASLSSAYARVDSLAPVSHPATSNAALPLAILGGCALVAAAVLAAVLFTRSSRGAEVVSGQAQDNSAAVAQPNHEAEPTEPAMKPEQPNAPGAEGAAAGPNGEGKVAPLSAEEAEGEDEDELAAGKKRQPRQPHTASEEKKNAAPEEKSKPKKEEKQDQADSAEEMLADRAKPVKAAPAPAPDGTKPAGSANDVGDLLGASKQAAKPAPGKSAALDDVLTGSEKPAPKPAAAPPAAADDDDDSATGLPDSPSRQETLAAMRGVEPAVRACSTAAEPMTGTAEVAITIAGDTGRVTSATVTGITGNTGTCIARAVRAARFPHFNKPTFSIKYPYRF